MRLAILRVLMVALVLALPAGAPAQPQSDGYRDGTGRVWSAANNRHGVVLRSRGVVIYLGRNCDAASPAWGRGRWEWANGGFLVIVGNRRVGFPRQEIDADQGSACRS